VGDIVQLSDSSSERASRAKRVWHAPGEPDPGISFLVAAGINATIVAPKRDTKAIGDRSELEVAVALARAGYIVSKPLGENQRYDLVVDDGQRLSRVQVKTGRIRGSVMIFSCCSTHGHRRTTLQTRPYTGQIELLAVFCPDNRKVYLLPEADLGRSKIQLRLAATRNNMTKTIRWASWYELP
jgi:PD-(D/E)XK endonuclease